jgi:2-methylisocitrate lyase-like PEP mutase family enzyme
MPCCFDALSARIVEQAGCPLTFMSGFSVAAARAGLPDTGLLTVTEMLDQGRHLCAAISIPVIGDGDTGHGNAANVQRTMHQFKQAGFAGIMLELVHGALHIGCIAMARITITDHWYRNGSTEVTALIQHFSHREQARIRQTGTRCGNGEPTHEGEWAARLFHNPCR